ncbi:hypothetical protein L1887_39129 [Cichorium endivia]|nr:hypothetical protein L1887_39129 [Cichorium endivia]
MNSGVDDDAKNMSNTDEHTVMEKPNEAAFEKRDEVRCSPKLKSWAEINVSPQLRRFSRCTEMEMRVEGQDPNEAP